MPVLHCKVGVFWMSMHHWKWKVGHHTHPSSHTNPCRDSDSKVFARNVVNSEVIQYFIWYPSPNLEADIAHRCQYPQKETIKLCRSDLCLFTLRTNIVYLLLLCKFIFFVLKVFLWQIYWWHPKIIIIVRIIILIVFLSFSLSLIFFLLLYCFCHCLVNKAISPRSLRF
jgi:hypothetical protein